MAIKTVKATAFTVAAALATALSMAPMDSAEAKEKCYGIAQVGQNDCGNLAGTHACAGQSTVDYDMGEWKLVDNGTCDSHGGSLAGEIGKVNPNFAE